MIDVAVIIVSWNVRDYLVNCLRSVYAELQRSQLTGSVWVVDNASTDGTVPLLDDLFPQLRIIANQENRGFGGANNQGMEAALTESPRYFFLLNPDTVLQPGALRALIDCLEERPEAGMAGARLVYGDGRFQHSAFYFPGLSQLAFDLFPLPVRLYGSRWNGRYPESHFHADHAPFRIDHPLGATMLVRTDVAVQTAGFDESYHMYCEEIDWSWRVREAGWEIYVVPAAEIVHYGGESTRQVPARSVINLWRSRAQLYRQIHPAWKMTVATWMVRLGMKWKGLREADPRLQAAYAEVSGIWRGRDGEIPKQTMVEQS